MNSSAEGTAAPSRFVFFGAVRLTATFPKVRARVNGWRALSFHVPASGQPDSGPPTGTLMKDARKGTDLRDALARVNHPRTGASS